MATKEVKNGLVWKVQCQECEANLHGKGIETVPLAEKFISGHSEETEHTQFDMAVLAHSISIEVIDAGTGEPCGKN